MRPPLSQYHFGGPCRNDELSDSDEQRLLTGMAFTAVVPVCKAFFELTYHARKDPGDIAFSCSEQWRRKLINRSCAACCRCCPSL